MVIGVGARILTSVFSQHFSSALFLVFKKYIVNQEWGGKMNRRQVVLVGPFFLYPSPKLEAIKVWLTMLGWTNSDAGDTALEGTTGIT